MGRIREMIVADNFMVAKVNAKMTEAVESFKVMKIANRKTPPLWNVWTILKNRVKRMPVLDKTGKVVGMVYMRDIFYAIKRRCLRRAMEVRNDTGSCRCCKSDCYGAGILDCHDDLSSGVRPYNLG